MIKSYIKVLNYLNNKSLLLLYLVTSLALLEIMSTLAKLVNAYYHL